MTDDYHNLLCESRQGGQEKRVVLELTAARGFWRQRSSWWSETRKGPVVVDAWTTIVVEWSPLVIVEGLGSDWQEGGLFATVEVGGHKYYVAESPREILAAVRSKPPAF